MIATSEQLIADVAAHTGESTVRARDALEIVLSDLGNRLGPAHRELVADELPTDLAALLTQPTATRGFALPIVELLLGPVWSLDRAQELLASVYRALGERLSVEAREAVTRAAGPMIAGFVAAPDPEVHQHHSQAHTLAEGRAGSTRPIAETAASRAQTGSIAEANPHADTKLSSASGSTQERFHETLAEGSPVKARQPR